MPLFEIRSDGLVAFRQLRAGADLYEKDIETLFWDNLDDLVGEVLFPIARQAAISGGGRPDLVALDKGGSVVVIEVKRDVDRSQLAQCLEYAGWARNTSLDELAGLYHRGVAAFWADWQEFTETDEPRRVTRSPRLVLVARDFEGRTSSAFEFLRDNGLPLTVIRVALYEDATGRKFLDIEGVEEPEVHIDAAGRPPTRTRRSFARVTIADLVGASLLSVGEELVWIRPQAGQHLKATVTEDGRLQLPDGRLFGSASGAAVAAAGRGSFDGWHAWRAPARQNRLLNDLRNEYLASEAAGTHESPEVVPSS